MLDIGWSELLIVGVVALIVVGPKDLPGMFRQLGRFTAKLRAMSREFSRAMESAADESGVKDAAKDIRAAADLTRGGLNPVKAAADRFEKWDPLKGARNQAPAAAAASAAATATAASAAPPAPDPAPAPAAPEPAAAPPKRRAKAPADAAAEAPAAKRKAVTRKKSAPPAGDKA